MKHPVFCPNWIDNYYTNLPLEYENWSLYEFSAQFDIVYYEPKQQSITKSAVTSSFAKEIVNV